MSKVKFTVKIFIKTRQYFQISCVFIFKKNFKKRFLINPFMKLGRGGGWRERGGHRNITFFFFFIKYLNFPVCVVKMNFRVDNHPINRKY